MSDVADYIRQADAAHRAGHLDREIDMRLRAFVASEGLKERPVEQMEKAAHLICDIGDSLRDPTSSREWQEATAFAQHRHGVVEGGVLELVKAQQPERAFAVSQRIKSPALVKRLREHTRARNDLSPAAMAYREKVIQKEETLRRLREAERSGRPESRLRELAALQAGLEEEIRGLEETLREEDLAALAGFGAPLQPDDLLPLLPRNGGCLVDLFLGGKEGIALLAYRGGGGVEMVAMVAADLDRKLFVEESARWFEALASGRSDRAEAALASLAKFLHDRLMCGLGGILRDRGLWQITIVPHLMTHALPLHLAPLCETGDRELFFEQFAVSYAPCVQLALSTALRPRPEPFVQGQQSAALIGDPSGDLPAGRAEQRAVQKHLTEHPWPAAPVPFQVFLGDQANLDAAQAELFRAGLAVIATHARFAAGDPTGSGLRLADGKGGKRLASVDEIYLGWRLDGSPVVVLSACESGMAHFDEASEIVSLPPALVCVGAAAVLSSLWPVEDVSTSFLVERFVHHLLDPGETPATSLSVACRDIRKISREEALDRCDEIIGEMEARGAQFGDGADAYVRLVNLKGRIADGPERPFASPFLWGGFFITGCGWRSVGSKGVLIRGPQAVMDMAMGAAKVKSAAKLFQEKEYDRALTLLREAVGEVDGLWLGRALMLQGDCLYRKPPEGALFDVEAVRKRLRQASEALERAHGVLTAHGAPDEARYCAGLIEQIKLELK